MEERSAQAHRWPVCATLHRVELQDAAGRTVVSTEHATRLFATIEKWQADHPDKKIFCLDGFDMFRICAVDAARARIKYPDLGIAAPPQWAFSTPMSRSGAIPHLDPYALQVPTEYRKDVGIAQLILRYFPGVPAEQLVTHTSQWEQSVDSQIWIVRRLATALGYTE